MKKSTPLLILGLILAIFLYAFYDDNNNEIIIAPTNVVENSTPGTGENDSSLNLKKIHPIFTLLVSSNNFMYGYNDTNTRTGERYDYETLNAVIVKRSKEENDTPLQIVIKKDSTITDKDMEPLLTKMANDSVSNYIVTDLTNEERELINTMQADN